MGDNLTTEQRSYCMSRVKGKDTSPERAMRSALHRRGLRFRKHVKELPGKPDIVFPQAKIVVFIDGDFWHGYGFSSWEGGLTKFWKEKIRRNIQRDRRNFRRLRKEGWRVIRVWQRRIQRDQQACVDRVIDEVRRGPRYPAEGSGGAKAALTRVLTNR